MNGVGKRVAHFLCLSLLGLGGASLLQVPASLGAERVIASVGGQSVSVPVSALAEFAKTGDISPEFAPLAAALGKPTLTQLQALLLQRFPTGNPVEFGRLMSIPLTEPLLKNISKALRSTSGKEDVPAVRAAIIRAAATDEGLTLLNVLRQFSGDAVNLDVVYTVKLATEIATLTNYRDAAVKAVMQESQKEAAAPSKASFAKLPDLRQSGAFKVVRRSLMFKIDAYRPTDAGLVKGYTLPVDLYLPEGSKQAVPLVVFSHGFGANRDAYTYLANHLASHGIAVAAPQHLGSDLQYRTLFLSGKFDSLVAPQEYISRSLDITFMLNELEKRVRQEPRLKGRLNLQRVGVLGNSLGGTTALSVAGAPINVDRLRQDCNDDRLSLSTSFLVQCRAQTAAKQNAALGDRRIKAVLAAYPLTSSIFGPESMSKIMVPTMIVAGSQDAFSSPVRDQIHPFLWLKTPNKYLMIMRPGTHFSTSEDAHVSGFPKSIVGVGLDVGRSYLQAMSVAFFKTYLSESPLRSNDLPYLSAGYAKTISREPLQLDLIQTLTSAQLEQAYGNKLPIPIVPSPIMTQ